MPYGHAEALGAGHGPVRPGHLGVGYVDLARPVVNGELKVSAILFYDGPGEGNITYAQVTWPNGTLACSQRPSVPIRHYSNAVIDINCGVRYVAGDVMLLTVSDSVNENATASFRLP